MLNKFPFFRRNSKTKKKYDDDPNCTLSNQPIRSTSFESSNHANVTTTTTRFRGLFSSSPASTTTAILPTSTAPSTITRPSSSSSKQRQHHFNNTSPCNMFLMGGSYYPGKDKKIKHTSRIGLLHQKQQLYKRRQKRFIKLFLSCIGCIIIFYIVSFILSFRKSSTSNNNNTKQRHNRIRSSFHLPLFQGSVKKKKYANINIKKQEEELLLLLTSPKEPFLKMKSIQDMKELYYPKNNKDWNINNNTTKTKKELLWSKIKNIVPEYAHRNDPNFIPQRIKDDDEDDNNDNDETQNNIDSKSSKKQEEESIQEETTPKEQSTKASIRTLSSMITDAASSCAVPSKISISLVIQCTLDRLWLLPITCSRWTSHPIIVVLFLSSKTEQNDAQLQELKSSCTNINLIFYEPTTSDDADESLKQNYPINKLRNIGIDAVQTSHFIVLDVDFIPSKQLQSILLQEEYTSILQSSNSNLFIVPAFERLYDCNTKYECQKLLITTPHFLPDTIEELTSCISKIDCIVFQENNNKDGHSTTNSKLWLTQNQIDGKIDPTNITCFQSARYEPYVIIRHCPNSITPYYDERFHGYGKNKISYIAHLRFMNYNWRVLPKGFLIHYPHPESMVKQIWNDREKKDLHYEMDELYPKFVKELMVRYGRKTFMPSCE